MKSFNELEFGVALPEKPCGHRLRARVLEVVFLCCFSLHSFFTQAAKILPFGSERGVAAILNRDAKVHRIKSAVSRLRSGRIFSAPMRRLHTWLGLLAMTNLAVAFSPPAFAGRISMIDSQTRNALCGKSLQMPSFPALHRPLSALRGGSKLTAIARQPAHDDADPGGQEDFSGAEKLWKALYAAAAVAATGGLAFSIEQGGTYAILSLLKEATGSPTFTELLGWLMAWAEDASLGGLALSAGACTCLQLLPIFNGILLAMAMGAMWGTAKGLACASFGATSAALIAAVTSRYALKDLLESNAATKPPAIIEAVASAISSSQRRSLALISLFRLSPIIPFVWSNYLLGLTPVKLLPYTVGTFLGTLPSLAVFVSAGVVGKAVVSGSMAPPPGLLAAGVAATFGVLTIIGRISQQELAKQAGKQE